MLQSVLKSLGTREIGTYDIKEHVIEVHYGALYVPYPIQNAICVVKPNYPL